MNLFVVIIVRHGYLWEFDIIASFGCPCIHIDAVDVR